MKTLKKIIQTVVLSSLLLAGCMVNATAQQLSERQKTAQAMFEQRCKMAGEKIHRTVENVEGIFLMKLRPGPVNFGDQFRLDDPYGRDVGGDGYITNFLLGRNARGSITEKDAIKNGYLYVEAIDPQDGNRYRYTGTVKEVTRTTSIMMGGDGKTVFKTKQFLLERAVSTAPAPRYGVTYDDISTREEREYWIAGSSLQVIDLKTNEVIAERIGYMMDWAQGSRAGGRSPWLLAANNACPKFPITPGGHPFKLDQTRNFAEKVLNISTK